MKGFTVFAVVLSVLMLSACTKKATEQPVAVTMSQADSYFLYAYALRDADALDGTEAPDMVVRTDGNATVYDFINHVIRECGTHLTGSVTVTDNGDHKLIAADFYKVEENPYKITSFKYDIKEPKGKFRQSEGTAVVNGAEYPIREIIRVSRF